MVVSVVELTLAKRPMTQSPSIDAGDGPRASYRGTSGQGWIKHIGADPPDGQPRPASCHLKEFAVTSSFMKRYGASNAA
jgi:hypothetical protein